MKIKLYRSSTVGLNLNGYKILMDPWLTVRRNRPRYGLSPKYFYKIIGKKSKRNIGFGDPIKLSDL